MEGISSGGTIGTENLERLDVVRHKAKGVLGTLRDLAIIKTQFAMLRDTGLLHPVQSLRAGAVASTGVLLGKSSSPSYDVVEHIIGEETEEKHVVRLLQHAYDAFSNAEFEEGKDLLKQASFISSCARCGRGILGIENLIEKGDLNEAGRRLGALIGLIPAYYSVIEGEAELKGEESKRETGRKEEKSGELSTTKIEEECSSCNASQIVELCHWDTKCLDYVIQFIDEKKKRNEHVYANELIERAKEYIGEGLTPLHI